MEKLADNFLCDRWKRRSDTSGGWQEFCSIWTLAKTNRQRGLIKVLGQLAITDAKTPVSPSLPASYVSDLADLDRAGAELRLALT
jgi:hypothetical protein